VSTESDQQPVVSHVSVSVDNPAGAGNVSIASTVGLPATGAPPRHVLVCVPGGGYSRDYWHPSNLDGTYSFLRAMCAHGYGVITLDTLGTGESERLQNGDDISFEVAAEAASRAVAQLADRLSSGALAEGGPPVSEAVYLGVGHSLGGAVVITQQAMSAPYAAVALLGYTNLCVGDLYLPHDREAELTATERFAWATEHLPERRWGMKWDDLPMYMSVDRARARAFYHLDDVPAEVIAAEEAGSDTVLPRGLLVRGMIPGVAAGHASQVRCPVFLGQGEVDSSPDRRAEPGTYASSNDITLFTLMGSAHCHNYSSPRQVMWDRLTSWLESLAVS
jgi:pimeloyl-ACP methyl ester carboxylesterase